MPRVARKKSESGVYHVMLRGINRQAIFEDDEDCEKYLQCLSDCKAISQFTLYAYCLMGNHLHLLLQEGKEPLEQIFKRLGARYVFWYNWKYKRSGHLFVDRFRSEPVDEDAYFLAVLRYIYQNPVKAGLVKDAKEYRWSSYGTMGRGGGLVSHEKVWELLPAAEFEQFVNAADERKFLDITEVARVTDGEATQLMKKLCKVSDTAAFQQLSRETQNKHLRRLHGENCSIRQLVRITGISKALVEKAVGQEDR